MTPNGWSMPDSVSLNIVGTVSQAYQSHVRQDKFAYRIAHLKAPSPSHKQVGHEALNRSPEYTGKRSNII